MEKKHLFYQRRWVTVFQQSLLQARKPPVPGQTGRDDGLAFRYVLFS